MGLLNRSKKDSLDDIYEDIESDLGNRNPVDTAFEIQNMDKSDFKIRYKKLPKGKEGYMHKDGKTIDIDPRGRKGKILTTTVHELEHVKKKDFKLDKRTLTKKEIFEIEDKRVYDTFRKTRDWQDNLKKNEGVAS